MELLAIFGVIVFMVLVLRNYTKTQNEKLSRNRQERRPAPARSQPKPFDHRRSEKVAPSVSIKGRAYVIDGDTIVLQKTQIRLFGVDAPELDHPYGQKAKWALVALCKGKTVTAKVTDMDTHGRTVAKCYLDDGRDLSAEMVKCGMAIDWPKFSSGVYTHMEQPNVRKKLWLADARQKGRMHVWDRFEANRKSASGAKKPSA